MSGTVQVTVHTAITEIAADGWNALSGTELPFLRHEFMAQGELTSCVSPEQGWQPRHLSIHDGKSLRAAMPLYEKSHSWGEFVFDWAWANAYDQAGLAYYPKLVSCTPFTPAPGRRLLLKDPGDETAATALLQAALALAAETDCSSLHVQFPLDDEIPLLEQAGLLIRKDCQFHWHNDSYSDFDDFLSKFTSAKRKKAKRERRRVREAGVTFRHLSGHEMNRALWDDVYHLISRTFMLRGALPYYDKAFFEGLSDALPDSLLVVLAEYAGDAVAAAVFYVSASRLFGRYWGSNAYFDSLHFETCYYQGIDYCIDHGLTVFEPGTQGEHKIARGFTPIETASAHWLAHAEFANVIERYLGAESHQVDRYIEAVHEHTPFRRDRRE